MVLKRLLSKVRAGPWEGCRNHPPAGGAARLWQPHRVSGIKVSALNALPSLPPECRGCSPLLKATAGQSPRRHGRVGNLGNRPGNEKRPNPNSTSWRLRTSHSNFLGLSFPFCKGWMASMLTLVQI